MYGNTMVALETDIICRVFMEPPPKKDDGTITFWAVNIVEDISG